MLPLTGYADRLSVRPGETIKFHTANATGASVAASLVRVICADPNPAGTGIKLESLPVATTQISVPTVQSLSRGSYAVVPASAPLQSLQSVTLVATIQPTSPAGAGRTIMSMLDLKRGGIALALDRHNRVAVSIGTAGHPATGGIDLRQIETPTPLELHHWYRVWVSLDRDTDTVTVGAQSLASGHPIRAPLLTTAKAMKAIPVGGAALIIGGTYAGQDPYRFNGKIECPMVFDRALTTDDVVRAAAGEAVAGLVAAWDFAQDIDTSRIIDTGRHGLHGKLVNSPTRAMRGSTWTGREQCYRHASDQYAAINFHDDDLDDCHWPVTHEFKVPDDFKSGAYALMLKAGDDADNIPFFVVPPKGIAKSKLAVLVSTFTYTIYGNHARPEWANDPVWRNAWIKQAKDWQAYPHNPGAHAEYGLSTYNYHTDGSGIALASWHRPMLNLRIGYITYPYPDIRASGLRHYPADSHLLAWLDAKGHDCDLITDWELHHEGVELLERYTCVMTGTHPEYHTPEMLDALEAYRNHGGRFMYLGGNGFYWKIALDPEKSGQIEIRRAEGGIRAWAAEPGEYYNQFDGEYGGLWRRNGRPPQKLVGVGFTAQGNFVGSYYRIRPEARMDPHTSWMFDGITEETIGGFGFSGHGAAGFELDRADRRLGTPSNARIVAQSENHPPEAPWVLVPEEQLTHITTIPGESHKQLIRADMVIFSTPEKGAVFSTGSITFCGSLPYNNFDNSVSTLLGNVLTRFLGHRAPLSEHPE